MGGLCSGPQVQNKMEIQGNHNLALMLNGVHYNITSIINGLVYEIIKTSRLDLIRIHFASALLILILMILVFHWLFPPRHAICSKINILGLEFLNIPPLFF